MSKQIIAAKERQGCSTPTTLPNAPILVNEIRTLPKRAKSNDAEFSLANVATISNEAFGAKHNLLAVVAITDLITGEGFYAFSNLDDDRQEAVLSQILALSFAAQQHVELIQRSVDSPSMAGGAA